MTLTLTLDRVIRHTVVHQSSTCMYVPNLIEIRQTFCGRTNGWTDVRTYLQTDIPPSNVIRSTRSRPKNQKLVALLQKWTPVHHWSLSTLLCTSVHIWLSSLLWTSFMISPYNKWTMLDKKEKQLSLLRNALTTVHLLSQCKLIYWRLTGASFIVKWHAKWVKDDYKAIIKNVEHFSGLLNALIAISKGMRAVKLCSN